MIKKREWAFWLLLVEAGMIIGLLFGAVGCYNCENNHDSPYKYLAGSYCSTLNDLIGTANLCTDKLHNCTGIDYIRLVELNCDMP